MQERSWPIAVFPPRQDLDPACSAKGPAQADPDALSASQKAAQRAAERRRDRGRDKERGIGRFGAGGCEHGLRRICTLALVR